MFSQILRPIARRAIRSGTQNRLAHHGSDFKKVTFDEATVPEGPWKEGYAKKQKKQTIQLAVGVTALVLTVLTVIKNELIFFNFLPPKPKDA